MLLRLVHLLPGFRPELSLTVYLFPVHLQMASFLYFQVRWQTASFPYFQVHSRTAQSSHCPDLQESSPPERSLHCPDQSFPSALPRMSVRPVSLTQLFRMPCFQVPFPDRC